MSLLTINILLISIIVISAKIYFDIKGELLSEGVYEVNSEPVPIKSEVIVSGKQEPSLSPRDLDIFTNEMNELNDFLKSINKAIESSEDIKSVLLKKDRLLAIQSWKHSIEKEPERLIEVNDFIYKQVPKLSELINLYSEISQRDLICEESIIVLKEALDAITIVADDIKESYFEYNKRELIRLKSSIKQVKRGEETT